MPAIRSRIEKAEVNIFPGKSSQIDKGFLDYVTAIDEGLNRLKKQFDDRKRELWRECFGSYPEIVTPEQMLEEAKELTEKWGSWEAYCRANKGKWHSHKSICDPVKKALLDQIFRD